MYAVRFSPRAQRDLRSLQPELIARLLPRIEALLSDPRPPGSKKLSGEKDIWRIRIGDYRVIYAVDDGVRIVEVRRVGHRGDIYR